MNTKKPLRKSIQLLIVLALAVSGLSAQVKIGENIQQLQPHTILELESTDKGLLIPRMTTEQRNLILKDFAPEGLMIYNMTLHRLEVLKSVSNPTSKTSKDWRPANSANIQIGRETPPNPIEGQVFYDLNTHHLKVFDGTAWQMVPFNKDLQDGEDEQEEPFLGDQQLSLIDGVLYLERGGSVDIDSLIVAKTPSVPTAASGNQDLSSSFDANNVRLNLSLSGDPTANGALDLSPLKEVEFGSGAPQQNLTPGKIYVDIDSGATYVGSNSGNAKTGLPAEAVNSSAQNSSPTTFELDTAEPAEIIIDSTTGEAYVAVDTDDDGVPDKWENTDNQDLKFENITSSSASLTISDGEAVSLQTSGSLSFSRGDDGQLVIEAGTNSSSIYNVDGVLSENRTLSLSDGSSGQSLTFQRANINDRLVFNTDMRINDRILDENGQEGRPGEALIADNQGRVNWKFNGSKIVEKTSDYSVSLEDDVVLVTPASDTTISLPTPNANYLGKTLTIKRMDDGSSGNKMKIQATTTIDGTNAFNMNLGYQGYTLKAFGSQWVIVEQF